jgi:nitrite reductase/ring-hydroxylating ferredoxin subunit
MTTTLKDEFVRVAGLDELPEGATKAVKVKGHSIALFNVNGRYYATDNQCPHMGYPLVKGAVRNDVLTCDWHGWSFDLEGGGCVLGGCDDLQTFPVEVRDGDLWLNAAEAESSRREQHLRLLEDGLLTEDSWTLSKAIALLLADGLPEEQVIDLLVTHMGRHIATHRGPDGGRDVAQLVNGIKVARRYEVDERLIPLMHAANAAAGPAGDRPDVEPLPPPVPWEKVDAWVRLFSRDKIGDGIEKCLVTARKLGGQDEKILPLIYECAVEPHFFGFTENLIHLGNLAELVEELGWDRASELVCNLSAKILGRGRPVPERFRLDAIGIFDGLRASLEDQANAGGSGSDGEYDEDALTLALTSGDLKKVFQAVTDAINRNVDTDRVIASMVLLAGNRMARTPVNMNAGWGALTAELNLANALRTAKRYGGEVVGKKGLYHVAFRFFDDRWLNISNRPLSEVSTETGTSMDGLNQEDWIEKIVAGIESVRIQEIGREVRDYLNAGNSGDLLLHALGTTILKDDTGDFILPTLRTIFEEWENPIVGGHPARNQLLIGLARYATDVRRRKGSHSAAMTAQRFARKQTAVDLYD